MTITDFILSDKRSHRLTRHLVFWGLYLFLFYGQSVTDLKQNNYFIAFVSVCCYVPAVIIAVYVFSEIVCPWLEQKKYLRFLAGCAMLFVTVWIVNAIGSMFFFHFTSDASVTSVRIGTLVALTSINSTHPWIAGGMILGYKMGKEGFFKQLENQRLAKEKIDHELQLQKGRLYPSFLFQSLNSLYGRIQSDSPDAPELILKLSDLLSYLLYESEVDWVPLEKELEMVHNLVLLENLNKPGHVSVQSNVNTSGNKMIKPLILFPLLHNCLDLTSRPKGNLHVDLQIDCIGDHLRMNVMIINSIQTDGMWLRELVADVRGRLNYLFQKSAELSINEHTEGTQLQLHMMLAEVR